MQTQAMVASDIESGPSLYGGLRQSLLHPNVIVAALGYLVDTYDMILFSLVRRPSLETLGYHGDELLAKGVLLINLQMIGMLVGGFFWGMLGDKKGRSSVLFGSILLYSVANFANAWATNIETYGALRLLAGFGLAGELGAAITLVSEALPTEHRGYAAAIIAAFGSLGVVMSATIGELCTWQNAYVIGGLMGFCLLALRMRTLDSELFHHLEGKGSAVKRGDLRMLCDKNRIVRFAACALAAGPLWFMSGILSAFAPEIGKSLGVTGELQVSTAIVVSTAGYLIGDLINGFLSQKLASRKKVILLSLLGSTVFTLGFLLHRNGTPWSYYAILFVLGYFTGYWALLITATAEQFGTNLRATVTTTVPNLVRALVIPMTLSLEFLRPEIGMRDAALTVAGIVLVFGLVAGFMMRETYGKSLDFLEQ